MYLPDQFAVTEPAALRALIEANPLAAVVTRDASALDADHIPLLLDEEDKVRSVLCGHVARANPMWRRLNGTSEVLAIFNGTQHYVSPAWYPSKAIEPRVVPTWNYAVVHAHGKARAIEDRDWLRRLVTKLTLRHERDSASPWRVEDAPAEFIDRMLGAIVGIEIEVSRWIGKFKASQNRSAEDRAGVRAATNGLGCVSEPRS